MRIVYWYFGHDSALCMISHGRSFFSDFLRRFAHIVQSTGVLCKLFFEIAAVSVTHYQGVILLYSLTQQWSFQWRIRRASFWYTKKITFQWYSWQNRRVSSPTIKFATYMSRWHIWDCPFSVSKFTTVHSNCCNFEAPCLLTVQEHCGLTGVALFCQFRKTSPSKSLCGFISVVYHSSFHFPVSFSRYCAVSIVVFD